MSTVPEAESLSVKIDLASDLLNRLDTKLKENSVALELPKAEGVIRKCQNSMISILESLQNGDVEFWLDRNSLLASCRTGWLLPWEMSLSIGMISTEWERLVSSSIPASCGFEIEGNLLTGRRKKTDSSPRPEVKTCIWMKAGGRLLSGSLNISEQMIYPLKPILLNEREFLAPNESWSILKAEYGADWMKHV